VNSPTTGSEATDVALALKGVSKRFGTTEALRDVSMAIRRGTVHALLGENGAGKTTLVNVAFGLVGADAGTVVGGAPPRAIESPGDAMAVGVGMVHQHFTNVPAMTVAENVALGGRGAFRAERAAATVVDIGRRTGLSLDPAAKASSLPVGAQQRLEIVKALARNATTLLLDEPTAVLAPAEAMELLAWLRSFADRGGSVVLITHRLREALAIADHATVLRRGAVVLTAPADSLDESSLAAALLGREPAVDDQTLLHAKPVGHATTRSSGAVADLTNVSVKDERGVVVVRDVTLSIHGGEILGIAAVEGSGQHELLRVLADRGPVTEGVVSLPRRIGFVPEDRHRDGLVLDFSVADNLALRGAGQRTGWVHRRAERTIAERALVEYDVRAASVFESAAALSGGNQQKLVLARELADSPALVVAENPTRGLDIRATRDVHARLRRAASDGAAIVLHSSDLDEVLALADRVVVMHAGALRAGTGDRESVGRAMLGVA
jgi:general nucleoside transport system ATP-binding protein